MTQNKEISFLIGAGFSVEAGIPIRSEINSRLETLKWDEFIIQSETTTFFLREPNPNSHWLNVIKRKFVESMISFYVLNVAKDFDYEDFYDYCYKLLNGLDDSRFEAFYLGFVNEKKSSIKKGDAISTVIRTIDYLVNDLLRFERDLFETNIINAYQPFLNILRKLQKQATTISIFTLNHDLLLEKLLGTELYVEYSDGFEINGSKYFIKKKHQQIRIKCFKNKYDKQIRLYKLHGSIDHYIYNFSEPFEMVKIPKNLYAPDLHRETKVGTNWIEENCWTLYQPNFLSGTTTKILKYDKHPYYINQFNQFLHSLENSSLLICIGYGLSDEKINEFIKKGLSKNLKVLVVKRSKTPAEFFQMDNVFHYGENLGIADLRNIELEKYI